MSCIALQADRHETCITVQNSVHIAVDSVYTLSDCEQGCAIFTDENVTPNAFIGTNVTGDGEQG